MSNPVRGSNPFDNLVDVMQEIGKQTFTTDSKGNKIYEDASKVYVKVGEQDRLITAIGADGRRTKEISSVQLAEIVESVVVNATETGAFNRTDVTRLEKMVKGIETLRDRMVNHQELMSPLKWFILKSFGYLNPYDAAIEKVDQVCKLAKVQMLSLQIRDLKKQNAELMANIKDAEKNLKKMVEQSTNLKDEETAKKLDNEIVDHCNGLYNLESQKQELLTIKDAHLVEMANLITAQSMAKERLVRANGSVQVAKDVPGIGLFGNNKIGKENLKLAEIEEKEASVAVKIAKKKLKEPSEKLEEIEASLKKNEKQQANISHKLELAQARYNVIKRRFTEQGDEAKAIRGMLTVYQGRQSVVVAKEREHAILQTGSTPLRLAISKEPAIVLPFNLPPDIPNDIIKNLLAKLGPTPEGKTEEHIAYLRSLIFGISIGQKKAIEVLDKQIDFGIKDLKKMLEGGVSVVNMCYIAHYLDSYIPKIESEKRNPSYISAIKKLQADLKRSLPIAIKMSAIGALRSNQNNPSKAMSTLAALSKEISKEMEQMKKGERLLIPIGTFAHATLLTLEKMDNESFKPILYNTGDGVDEHITTGLQVKALVDNLNVLRDLYPVTKIYPHVDMNSNQDNFERMMVTLAQLTFTRDSTVKDMNRVLSHHLGEGKSGPAKPIQINGVCSFQILTEAFKDILDSKINYNAYKHDLLSYLQEEFQKITHAMEPLIDRDEHMRKLYALHQAILEDNQKQIVKTEQVLVRAR